MKMLHVCLMELGYEGRFQFVKRGDLVEGAGYGEGDGRVRGARISGAVRSALVEFYRSLFPGGVGTFLGVLLLFLFLLLFLVL